MPLPPLLPARHRALTAAFLARFFESEAAAGPMDMRQSFFWLVAFLATPGICLPLFMTLKWDMVAQIDGGELLRVTSLVDKTMYLGLSCVSTTLVSAFIWHTLILDRRDGLILGTLPVSLRTIYTSKLAALASYVVLLSAGMHVPAAFLYGMGLGLPQGTGAVLRNALALIVAGTAVNAFVFASIAGLQSVGLALIGPRRFARLSPTLQVLTVAAATALFLSLPATSMNARELTGPMASSWARLWLPPFWFLGFYEWIAGTDVAAMPFLAGRALTALGVSTGALLLSYPLASRRAFHAALEGAGAGAATSRRVGQGFTRWLAAGPQLRGLIQFLLSAVARTHQNRLVLCVFAGIGVAVTMPMIAFLGADPAVRSTMSDLPLLVAPLLLICALGSGLRLAIAVPSELPASWIFAAASSPPLAGRSAARRVILALAVAVPLVAVAPTWITRWGPAAAFWHVAACAFGGAILTDVLLWGFTGVPCAKRMAPARASLQFRWPFMAIGVFTFTYGFAVWQRTMLAEFGPAAMLLPLVCIWGVVAPGSRRASHVNSVVGDLDGPVTLNLDTLVSRGTESSGGSHA